MEGMEQKSDGYLWTWPSQSNMAIQCAVQLSYCLGDLQCHRITCPYFINEKKFNDTFFHGNLDRQVSKGYLTSKGKSRDYLPLLWKSSDFIAICECMIYYILKSMTRLAIHVGEHGHNVQPGTQRESIEKVRKLVGHNLTNWKIGITKNTNVGGTSYAFWILH